MEFPVKKLLLIFLLAASVILPRSVKAEPVTMVLLAPVALEAAKVASPYAISALRRGGLQLYEVGKDAGNMLLLPLGILQATVGAPFGFFGQGVENIVMGLAAPFQLVGDLLMVPLCFIGGAMGT